MLHALDTICVLFLLLVQAGSLPEALLQYVVDSNAAFEKEVATYNEKKLNLKGRQQELGFIKPAKSVRFASQDRFSIVDHGMEALPSDAKRARSNSPSPERMQVRPVHISVYPCTG